MGNAIVARSNPIAALRQALFNLLQEGNFKMSSRTCELIHEAEQVLCVTNPTVAHERAVGLFRYNNTEHVFQQVYDEQGLDSRGKPRPGCEYLFRQPIFMTGLTQ